MYRVCSTRTATGGGPSATSHKQTTQDKMDGLVMNQGIQRAGPAVYSGIEAQVM